MILYSPSAQLLFDHFWRIPHSTNFIEKTHANIFCFKTNRFKTSKSVYCVADCSKVHEVQVLVLGIPVECFAVASIQLTGHGHCIPLGAAGVGRAGPSPDLCSPHGIGLSWSRWCPSSTNPLDGSRGGSLGFGICDMLISKIWGKPDHPVISWIIPKRTGSRQQEHWQEKHHPIFILKTNHLFRVSSFDSTCLGSIAQTETLPFLLQRVTWNPLLRQGPRGRLTLVRPGRPRWLTDSGPAGVWRWAPWADPVGLVGSAPRPMIARNWNWIKHLGRRYHREGVSQSTGQQFSVDRLMTKMNIIELHLYTSELKQCNLLGRGAGHLPSILEACLFLCGVLCSNRYHLGFMRNFGDFRSAFTMVPHILAITENYLDWG